MSRLRQIPFDDGRALGDGVLAIVEYTPTGHQFWIGRMARTTRSLGARTGTRAVSEAEAQTRLNAWLREELWGVHRFPELRDAAWLRDAHRVGSLSIRQIADLLMCDRGRVARALDRHLSNQKSSVA